jgi:2-oxoisovalerate dehydrogenase E2 component (dihydrolipoyl transacylase)
MTESVTGPAATGSATTQRREFRLPDVGEGLTEADIVSWRVQPGDTVIVNQIIVDIETAKAIVELPSPYAGVVAALLVPEGQTVDVGTPIIAVDVPGPAGGGPGGGGPGSPRHRRPARGAPPLTRPPSRPRDRIPPPKTWCRRSPRPRSGRPSWSATASRPARPPGAHAGAALLRPWPQWPGGRRQREVVPLRMP